MESYAFPSVAFGNLRPLYEYIMKKDDIFYLSMQFKFDHMRCLVLSQISSGYLFSIFITD